MSVEVASGKVIKTYGYPGPVLRLQARLGRNRFGPGPEMLGDVEDTVKPLRSIVAEPSNLSSVRSQGVSLAGNVHSGRIRLAENAVLGRPLGRKVTAYPKQHNLSSLPRPVPRG